MTKFSFLSLSFLFLFPFTSMAEVKPYEMPRTEIVQIADETNGRQYELYIKLPEKYSEMADQRYPVLYASDGKWSMDLLSGATEYIVPDTILVGISWQTDIENKKEHVSRFRDYTALKYEKQEHQEKYHGGQAHLHLDFIREQVFAFVNEKYRTKPDERTYFGYSLGGEFGSYIILSKPDTFKNYIIGSPSVSAREIAHFKELSETISMSSAEVSANVFVSIGELEKDRFELTQELVSIFQSLKIPSLNIGKLRIIENSDHGTAFPDSTIQGVRWLSNLAENN